MVEDGDDEAARLLVTVDLDPMEDIGVEPPKEVKSDIAAGDSPRGYCVPVLMPLTQ